MTSLDPVILFFLLGLIAGLARSELRLPAAIYDFLSIALLLAIGLKGGVELAKQPLLPLLPQFLTVVAMGAILPLLAYPVLLRVGGLKRADAASIAAHYGSVSVGTYAVAVAYLAYQQVAYEEYIPVFVVLLEMPAIVVGILLARGISRETRWTAMAHEVMLGKGMVLLAGGLAIGWIAGPVAIEPAGELFFGLFKGFLALFLLEMGLITASQIGGLRRHGLFLAIFGVLAPLCFSLIGAALGWSLGLSPGGTALLATLFASASYIAVPAAMRMAVPEANPSLSLGVALGVTFPFNILVGVPLYLAIAQRIHTWGT
jgi:hypothetical protein